MGQLAMVSALVGAGGNAGAVFAGFAFYKQDWEDTLTPFKLHAGFVMSMALLSPLFHWPEYGSMFTAPSIATGATLREGKAVQKDGDIPSNEGELITTPDLSPTDSTAALKPAAAARV